MSKLKELYLNSMREFKSPKTLALIGLMAALAMVLGMVATINIGEFIRIGFSGLPNRMVEAMFGPFVGCIFGGALDIIKFIAKPTGVFFPGFTLTAMLGGILYGSILYRKEISILRIFCAELIAKVFLNCILNSIWLKILYDKGFWVMLPSRLLKNAIALPIDTILVFLCLALVARITHKFRVVPFKRRTAVSNK